MHPKHKKTHQVWLIYHDRAAYKQITGAHLQRTKMHTKLRDQSTHLLLKVWKYYFWVLMIICWHQLFLSSLKLVLFHAQGSAQEEYTDFLLCWFKGEICGTGFNIAKSIKWALESNTAYSQIQPKGLSDVNDPNSSSFCVILQVQTQVFLCKRCRSLFLQEGLHLTSFGVAERVADRDVVLERASLF